MEFGESGGKVEGDEGLCLVLLAWLREWVEGYGEGEENNVLPAIYVSHLDSPLISPMSAP